MKAILDVSGNLSAQLIRRDGTQRELGTLGDGSITGSVLAAPLNFWRRLYKRLRRAAVIPASMSFAAFLIYYLGLDPRLVAALVGGIVTTAGVNYMASDFASGGVTPTISGFKFHDSGTGTVAAAVGDTALGTPAGPARVSGTPTNPTANQYRSVATIPYTATLAITEWGLFSASTAGTLWDRRVFTAVNVVNGDSIQFTYTLTVNNGGT